MSLILDSTHFYTDTEVKSFFGISSQTLLRWRHAGLRAAPVGRHLLFSGHELLAWLHQAGEKWMRHRSRETRGRKRREVSE